MTTNETAIAQLPKLTREFPSSIEFLLAIRHSARCYDQDGGVVPISKISPETDVNENSSGEMYAMTIQVPICGHATVLKQSEEMSGIVNVCEPVYAHLDAVAMKTAVQIVNSSSLRWVNRYDNKDVRPIRAPNIFMDRSSVVYELHAPLSVYTNVAAIEAANHSADSNFWRTLYPPMELIECHYGLAGLLYDNNVLSMGQMAGADENPAIEVRKPNKFHRGFIDVCFTPQSKGAGRVRLLSFGVSIRVMTRRTVKLACDIISAVGPQVANGVGDWVLRCMGFTTVITDEDVHSMVNTWKNMCEFNMPTVHVFESRKVIVISITSGVLIRPLRTLVSKSKFTRQGPFVDSMCVYHSDTMRYLGATFPRHDTEVTQFSSTSCLLINHFAWATEPRVDLGIQMTLQGMNRFPIKGDATMVSLGESEPIVKTEVLDAIMKAQTDECKIVVPGKNVVTAFINKTLNSEDACSVSKEFAESGQFAWMGYIDYPLPMGCGDIRRGTVLEGQSWWKPAMKGLVVRVFMNRSGGLNAVVQIYSKKLEIGDKLATWHGLKFTVGELIPYRDMPWLEDTVTGEKFKPNLLISTKNLNRGIGGQIREMNAVTSRFSSIASFRAGGRRTGKDVFSFADELKTEATSPTAYIVANDSRISFKDTNAKTRTLKCNYGIMRVMQLRHVSSLKQHYPASAISSITVKRGRYREGTARLGETELFSMMMQGLNLCVSEAIVGSDKVNVDVCSMCAAIPIYCDCAFPKPDTTVVGIRYSAIQMNVYATTAMLNDPDRTPLTLRYLTST